MASNGATRLMDDSLDMGIAGGVESSVKESEAFELPGERVFAIKLRKVRFKWFHKREIEQTRLERDNFWLVVGVRRGDDEEEGQRGIEVDLDDDEGEVLARSADDVVGCLDEFGILLEAE
jgi:hypothetical protein